MNYFQDTKMRLYIDSIRFHFMREVHRKFQQISPSMFNIKGLKIRAWPFLLGKETEMNTFIQSNMLDGMETIVLQFKKDTTLLFGTSRNLSIIHGQFKFQLMGPMDTSFTQILIKTSN